MLKNYTMSEHVINSCNTTVFITDVCSLLHRRDLTQEINSQVLVSTQNGGGGKHTTEGTLNLFLKQAIQSGGWYFTEGTIHSVVCHCLLNGTAVRNLKKM